MRDEAKIAWPLWSLKASIITLYEDIAIIIGLSV